METLEALKTRRSCRSFDINKPVEQEKLDKILEAGLYAPSGVGSQSPIFVVVRNKEEREWLRKINAGVMGRDGDPFYGAPVIIVVLARKDAFCYVYDGALAMGNLMNAAHALGVQSIWIHRAKEEFESEEGKAWLKAHGIEGDYEGIGHCALGYGNPVPAKERKPGRVFYIDK